jgi:hypothetical protein
MKAHSIYRFLCITSLYVTFLLVSAYTACSQDIIIKRDGSEISARIVEVGVSEIKYYKVGTTSPVYAVKKAEVFMIRYENGNKDVFEKEQTQTQAPIATSNPKTYSISNREVAKTRSAATVGYVMTLPIMAFGIYTATAEETETAIAAGSVATLLVGISVPIIANRARKTRELVNVDGNFGMRIVGWTTYALGVSDALVLIGLGFSDVDTGVGPIVAVTLLGSLSSIFLASDAAATARQANKFTALLHRVQPFAGAAKDPFGTSYQTVGLRVKF